MGTRKGIILAGGAGTRLYSSWKRRRESQPDDVSVPLDPQSGCGGRPGGGCARTAREYTAQGPSGPTPLATDPVCHARQHFTRLSLIRPTGVHAVPTLVAIRACLCRTIATTSRPAPVPV